MSAVALQIAVYDALAADSTLSGLVSGIYDNPTQVSDPGDNSAFPFVTVGEARFAPWDTDTEKGREATVVIHTWSRAQHHIECKRVQEAIYNILHRVTLPMTGHVWIGCDLASQDAQRDPDAITVHGVQEFLIRYEEV